MKKTVFVFHIPVDDLGVYILCMGNHCSKWQNRDPKFLKQIHKGGCNQQEEIKYRWRPNVASEFPNWVHIEEFNMQVHPHNADTPPPDDF